MSLFDFKKLVTKSLLQFDVEVKTSRGIQDEVKIYNERYPKSLAPLNEMFERMDDNTNVDPGEFSEGELTGDTDEEKVWAYFLNKGFKKKAIAGVMGNMEAESGINPKRKQLNGGPGRGLIQWELKGPNGSDRFGTLTKWAEKAGKDKWDIQTQLDFLWKEMTDGSHDGYFKRAGNSLGVDLSGKGEEPVKKFGQIDNIEKAMKIFELTIERARDKHYDRRLKFANNFYEKYKDWTGSSNSSGGGDGTFKNPYRDSAHQITSPFGMRSGKLHKGIDLQSIGAKKVKLYATSAGKIVRNVTNYGTTSWGNYVVIDHGTIKGYQIFSLYAHLKDPCKTPEGGSVKADEFIANEGNTGSVRGATGIHLHLEIREGTPGSTWDKATPVDPTRYISFK